MHGRATTPKHKSRQEVAVERQKKPTDSGGERRQRMPKLKNALITFRTNDEDKDADTNVTVELRDNTGELFARVSNPFGYFDDQTTNGPFDLELLNRPEKAQVDGGDVLIRIDPKGDDTWHFNFQLECRFEDGSTISSAADGLSMNEHEEQQQTFGLPS
jgi:hypothetical protein